MDIDVKKLASAILKLAEVHDTRLGEIAKALDRLATQTKNLGNADAMTEMGGLEGLGKSVEDAASTLADSLNHATERLSNALENDAE